MTDSILPKYLSRTRDDNVDSANSETDLVTDLGCFGYLRGIRDRAIMLELRKKDGTIRAISYAFLERIEFDPSQGITLVANGQKINITGQNLNTSVANKPRLFESLTRHRVLWIQEADEATLMQTQRDEVVVLKIEVRVQH